MTAPRGFVFFVVMEMRGMFDWMYAAIETSPAAQPEQQQKKFEDSKFQYNMN